MRNVKLLHYCAALLICIGSARLLSGQTNIGSAPPAGDPEVFLMYLRYQDHIEQDIASRRATDSSGANVMADTAASALKISTVEFAKISPVYRALAADLDALDREGLAYRDQVLTSHQNFDITLLQGFETRRLDTIRKAMNSLQSTLSPAAWTAVYGYIDGDFRKSLRRYRTQ